MASNGRRIRLFEGIETTVALRGPAPTGVVYLLATYKCPLQRGCGLVPHLNPRQHQPSGERDLFAPFDIVRQEVYAEWKACPKMSCIGKCPRRDERPQRERLLFRPKARNTSEQESIVASTGM